MSPGEALKVFIASYVRKNKIDKGLENEVPKKWEKYGDFVLFDERTFNSDVWKCQGPQFWHNVANILKCKRIGIKSKIKSDGFRTPNVTIVLGDDPWIMHKDNEIIHTWHVKKNMFSAGNSKERHRIANLSCENEVVVDLFAGIGYFTLPFLIHAKASFVHACEWNPVACIALKRNLELNNVLGKCNIYEGDNRVICPRGVANRVNLGLIPTSEGYWKIACEALLNEGGILHIHENVETKQLVNFCPSCQLLTSEIDSNELKKNIYIHSQKRILQSGDININWKYNQWFTKGVHILHSLIQILTSVNDSNIWICNIEDVNYVKSYAPHVHHVVFDVRIENLQKS
ncbi:hypothetical protein RUM44_013986 [Polyplax serrata]|uniref:tRNA(Phe) (4-demethylwyosine(37)-C(7)) aminocarboxypropyltransferase n=1 Tax=Polyplax serrata TaxID=468196 RepID=A0ABR1BKD5_POLSC